MMRKAFQILAIPYRVIDEEPVYCVFHRSDMDCWQFISGGGENNENSLEAAKREVFEECGVRVDHWILLKSMSYLPVTVISEEHRRHWPHHLYVIPEYTFGFECIKEISLSREHVEAKWMSYNEAKKILQWDSNRTALYELHCNLISK